MGCTWGLDQELHTLLPALSLSHLVTHPTEVTTGVIHVCGAFGELQRKSLMQVQCDHKNTNKEKKKNG